jgi:hypothetical protein
MFPRTCRPLILGDMVVVPVPFPAREVGRLRGEGDEAIVGRSVEWGRWVVILGVVVDMVLHPVSQTGTISTTRPDNR